MHMDVCMCVRERDYVFLSALIKIFSYVHICVHVDVCMCVRESLQNKMGDFDADSCVTG